MNFAAMLIVSAALLASKPDEPHWKTFRGMCDASAVEMLSNDLFVAGNDEDNALRIYSRSQEGLPVQSLDFSLFYRLPRKEQEIDLEGSARIDDRIYWISSHGANAKGKVQLSRHRFFATEIVTNNGVPGLRPAGQLYTSLVRDLVSEPALARFNLAAAAGRAPKDANALNIEALAATPGKQLLIGFRNPIPNGKALLVPLLNPLEVTEGRKARFGLPVLLDLQGFGVRSMVTTPNGFLIVAGSYKSDGRSKLYEWRGEGTVPRLLTPKGMHGNPEGIALVTDAAGRTNLFVLNDDGTRKVLGTECKRVSDPHLRTFRAYEMRFSF